MFDIANVFANALNFIERNTKTGWVKQKMVDYQAKCYHSSLSGCANLMERGGTGFQTMIESYKSAHEIRGDI